MVLLGGLTTWGPISKNGCSQTTKKWTWTMKCVRYHTPPFFSSPSPSSLLPPHILQCLTMMTCTLGKIWTNKVSFWDIQYDVKTKQFIFLNQCSGYKCLFPVSHNFVSWHLWSRVQTKTSVAFCQIFSPSNFFPWFV